MSKLSHTASQGLYPNSNTRIGNSQVIKGLEFRLLERITDSKRFTMELKKFFGREHVVKNRRLLLCANSIVSDFSAQAQSFDVLLCTL